MRWPRRDRRALLALSVLATLLTPRSAIAAIAKVQATTANCSSGATCAVSITPTAGNLLVVQALNNGTATTASVSDDAGSGYETAFTLQSGSCTSPSGGYGCIEAATCNVRSGVTQVTVTVSPNDAQAVIVTEFSGNARLGCTDGASTGATGTGTAQTAGSRTTANAADVVLGFMLLDSAAPGAFAGSGSYSTNTSVACTGCSASIGSVFRVVAATAAYTATSTTVNSVPWRGHTTAYKATLGTTCNAGLLGAGWSLIDCQSVGGVTLCCALTNNALVHASTINVHDTLVVMCDSSATNKAVGLMLVSVTDSVGNTYRRIQGQQSYGFVTFTDGVAAAEDISYWWADNQTSTATWKATCTATALSGATFKDLDISGMVFRHSSGSAARGFVLASSPQLINDDTAAGGACPCLHTAISTIAGGQVGALLIAGGNENGAPTSVNVPWVGVDGDGSAPGGAITFYTFATTVGNDLIQGSGVPSSFRWGDSTASDLGSYMIGALLPPGTPPTVRVMGVGR